MVKVEQTLLPLFRTKFSSTTPKFQPTPPTANTTGLAERRKRSLLARYVAVALTPFAHIYIKGYTHGSSEYASQNEPLKNNHAYPL